MIELFNTFSAVNSILGSWGLLVSHADLINTVIFVIGFLFLLSAGAAVVRTQSVLWSRLNIDHELIKKKKLPYQNRNFLTIIPPLQCKKLACQCISWPLAKKVYYWFWDHLHFTRFVGTAKIGQSEMPLWSPSLIPSLLPQKWVPNFHHCESDEATCNKFSCFWPFLRIW